MKSRTKKERENERTKERKDERVSLVDASFDPQVFIFSNLLFFLNSTSSLSSILLQLSSLSVFIFYRSTAK